MGVTPESQGQAFIQPGGGCSALGWVLSSSLADPGKGAAAYTQTRSSETMPQR